MGCLRSIDLLNLVFEIKLLDIFMGREGPIEFDIYRSLYCLFNFFEFVETERERVGVVFAVLYYCKNYSYSTP